MLLQLCCVLDPNLEEEKINFSIAGVYIIHSTRVVERGIAAGDRSKYEGEGGKRGKTIEKRFKLSVGKTP